MVDQRSQCCQAGEAGEAGEAQEGENEAAEARGGGGSAMPCHFLYGDGCGRMWTDVDGVGMAHGS